MSGDSRHKPSNPASKRTSTGSTRYLPSVRPSEPAFRPVEPVRTSPNRRKPSRISIRRFRQQERTGSCSRKSKDADQRQAPRRDRRRRCNWLPLGRPDKDMRVAERHHQLLVDQCLISKQSRAGVSLFAPSRPVRLDDHEQRCIKNSARLQTVSNRSLLRSYRSGS
jgi:hypothetical protein